MNGPLAPTNLYLATSKLSWLTWVDFNGDKVWIALLGKPMVRLVPSAL